MNLKKGINLGGFLSQCVYEREHYRTFIVEEDIRRIRAMGFDHVRLPFDYPIVETEAGVRIQAGYDDIARVVRWCDMYGLTIILDLHRAYGYDFNDAGDAERNSLFASEEKQERFLNLWAQVADAFGHEDHVVFELLNEVVEEENTEGWNALIAKAVAQIRAVNRKTPIIYGGIRWNSAETLRYLEIPKEENILFTFHFYEPLLFTHQRAHWVPELIGVPDIPYPWNMPAYRKQALELGTKGLSVLHSQSEEMGKPFLREMMAEAVRAASAAGVGLYCGEFGVIDQAPLEDTVRWFRDVIDVLGEFDIGFGLWTYKEKDFGLMDEHYAPIRERLLAILTGERE